MKRTGLEAPYRRAVMTGGAFSYNTSHVRLMVSSSSPLIESRLEALPPGVAVAPFAGDHRARNRTHPSALVGCPPGDRASPSAQLAHRHSVIKTHGAKDSTGVFAAIAHNSCICKTTRAQLAELQARDTISPKFQLVISAVVKNNLYNNL